MSQLWQRGLWLWAGILAGVICLVFLPFSPKIRWLSFAVVTLVCLGGLWLAGRKSKLESQTFDFDNLPPESYRLPVVLVCGDALPALFAADALHQSPQGCWLRVNEITSLRPFTQQLLAQRPEWARQLSVMFCVNPQQQEDDPALSTPLYELRWQLVQLRRDSRWAVPLILYSTVANSMVKTPVWLSQQQSQPVTVWPSVTLPETLSDWQRTSGHEEQAARLQQAVMFFKHNEWLKEQVLPALLQRHDDLTCIPPQQVILHHVASLPDLKPTSLWLRWLSSLTALHSVAGWQPSSDAEQSRLRFPDFLFSFLPLGDGKSASQRVLRQGFNLLVLATLVALCCSAWQNRQLLHRVAFDIRHYESIEMHNYAPKVKAVAVLRDDAAQLDEWFRNGEPLHLGLGLYQGERLRLPLLTAIKNYLPPPPPAVISAPKTVRLDALSLFDTGKYQLKAHSTKLLVNALIGIKAKPGWLIVVAGHTDITGDARANQILSLKRAEALRDWMLSTSDVSPTCFAVQGYGATRPIATNDTAEGRAANRRVDISLVPQANACQATASQTTSGSEVATTPSKEN
jgi:outer membrane protein OmpA-like peptidoglycan-associated protein